MSLSRLIPAIGVMVLCTFSEAMGQMPYPMPPLGEYQERVFDSGQRGNPGDRAVAVFTEIVHTPDAAWTRLYFKDAHLEPGSFVRFTSLLDGEIQELDAAGLAMWNNSSAFLNGDTVLVELVAGPRTRANRLQLSEVQFEIIGAQQIGLCGICGSDTRVPSDEDFAGRLMNPGVCSAAVININSCLVSAGHCIGGSNQVIQFRVPNSFSNCNTSNPPVADQFPIVDKLFNDGGVGADWAVMTTGTNNLGQTIYQRYGEYRPIASAPPSFGQSVQVWGYGASLTCTLNHTQQLSEGTIQAVEPSYFRHNADTTGGNSGSAILHNDQIIGVVTHCPCPNFANRIDFAPFANAINQLCPDPTPSNNHCSTSLVVGEGTTPFSNFGATTTGPAEPGMCDFFGDDNIQNDVWFGHIAQCTGELTVSLCESSFTTKLAVYPFACPTEPGTVLACDLISCPDVLRSIVTLPVTQGQALRIRVGGHNGAMGDGLLTISCDEIAACPADLNGDGVVDVSDLLELLGAWGPCPGCNADINSDGVVDVSDLLILLGEWGDCSA